MTLYRDGVWGADFSDIWDASDANYSMLELPTSKKQTSPQRRRRLRSAASSAPPEPGSWQRNFHGGWNMSPEARRYQRQRGGRSAAWDYRVERGKKAADFDGRRGRVLIEAKYWQAYGRQAQAIWKVLNNTADWSDINFVRRVVEQARRQAYVAAGRPVEWHVSDPQSFKLVRQLFALTRIPSNVTVKYEPMKP
jgi:hypothetical protein